MQPRRVHGWGRYGRALPTGLGGIASLPLPDQHEAGRLTGLGRELQPPSSRERQGFFRLGNDKADGGRAQRFLHRPEQIRLAFGGEQQKPFRHARRQAARHRASKCVTWQDPNDGTRISDRMKQREGPTPLPFHLVDPRRDEIEVFSGHGQTAASFGPHPMPPHAAGQEARESMREARDMRVRILEINRNNTRTHGR